MKKKIWMALVAIVLVAAVSIPLLAHAQKAEQSFYAKVVEINGSTVVVQTVIGTETPGSYQNLSFDVSSLKKLDVKVGSLVRVTFTGTVQETDPARIEATDWELVENLRLVKFEGQWLDPKTAAPYDLNEFHAVWITEIYSDCFFVSSLGLMPYQFKINGTLSDEWCVGDWVAITCENARCNEDTWRVEADLLTIEQSDWRPDPNMEYKPVIYLYPEHEMSVSVKLDLDGRLTCTYPAYNTGWTVTASPDGTLTDTQGKVYNYLYWEGETYARYDFSRGFCVRGEDTAAFLEEALEKLGLTRREANEFIVYWLPLMEQNPYNVISFQTDAYTDAAKLTVEPAPDTLIRVFMAWQASDSFVELPAQELTAPERTGFTVVEWGGTELA